MPYFDHFENDLNLDYEILTHHNLEVLIPKYRNLLQLAKKQKYVGEYPFITSDYIGNVIDNLESLYFSYTYDGLYFRQKAMVRNLTNEKFLGKYWLNEKVFIHGGYRHLPTHFEFPANLNFYREGSYLNFDFQATKGKTYSILVLGMARSLGEMAGVNLNECLHVGGGYRWTFNKYDKAYKKGLVKSDEILFEQKINPFDSLIVKKSLQINSNGLIVEKVDWDKIMEGVKQTDKGLYNNMKYTKTDYLRYDKHIYIVNSPMNEALKNDD